jgi:transcriptional regulator with XRE-family HTH domain
MPIKEILERLATAREKAGLSRSQVSRLIDFWPINLELVESGAVPLEMEHFLKLCELYDVSEIWVLTGNNPYFDPALAVAAAQRNGMPEDEMRNFLEGLAMLRQNP